MIVIGLDIGSTTLSAVALDADTHAEYGSVTVPHQATLPVRQAWEHLQDPERLARLSRDIIGDLCSKYGSVAGIGLSGQMHGILYLDASGCAVSPLYTWQDHRCETPDEHGQSLLDELSQVVHTPVKSGYGLATHLWNLRHGVVPPEARWLTTISSYVAMQLTGNTTPALHPSDAAALGFFDMEKGCFDRDMLERLGVDTSFLPRLAADDPLAGRTADGIPVFWGLGDNQASFLGSVEDMEHGALLNIGTGSQISLMLPRYVPSDACELRPFIGQKYLAVGSALCGGRSFAMLESFFRECAALAGAKPDSLYEPMKRLLEDGVDTDLRFEPLFCGTRRDPRQRATISRLSPDNFTPAHFVRALLRGMVDELYGYFQELQGLSDRPVTHIVCSGNLVRLTPKLLPIVESAFSLPCSMADRAEEAACGAALYALRCLQGRVDC